MNETEPEEPLEPCLHLEHASETLKAITLYALSHEEFRAVWDNGIRESTDKACAEIAGARMAGRESGVTPEYTAIIPCPDGMEPACVFGAFRLAVLGEVNRRVKAMYGKPAGGVGLAV